MTSSHAGIQGVPYDQMVAFVDDLAVRHRVHGLIFEYNEAHEDEDTEAKDRVWGELHKLIPSRPELQGLQRPGSAEKFTRASVPVSVMKSSLENDFKRLSGAPIIGLPGTLSRDSFRASVGENFEHLQHRLTGSSAGPSTGSAPPLGALFKAYVDRQLAHLERLKQKFVDEHGVLGKFWSVSLADTAFDFQPLASDEHGFAPPTALTLTGKGHSGKLVYKARPGEVDKMVTDLFAAINAILPGGDKPLPEYQQEVFADGTLLSEFINGELLAGRIGYLVGVANSLGTLADGDAKTILERRLKILQVVAKQIGLTDLHEENLIYDSGVQKVFPIDLEAFDTGKSTGLYGADETGKVKTWADIQDQVGEQVPKLEKLVAGFNEQIGKVTRRLVPVATGTLHNTLEAEKRGSPVKASAFALIKESLEERQFHVNEEKLAAYLKACTAHEPLAVPNFTVKNNEVSAEIGGHHYVVAAGK